MAEQEPSETSHDTARSSDTQRQHRGPQTTRSKHPSGSNVSFSHDTDGCDEEAAQVGLHLNITTRAGSGYSSAVWFMCLCVSLFPAMRCGWWSVWSRRFCVRLSSGDVKSVPGSAEPCQHPVWWFRLAESPALFEASGFEHPVEPVQCHRHPAALQIFRPLVKHGAAGMPRGGSASSCSLGPLWTISPYR